MSIKRNISYDIKIVFLKVKEVIDQNGVMRFNVSGSVE